MTHQKNFLQKVHLSAGGSEAGHGEGRPAVHLSPGVGNLNGHPVQVNLPLQAAVQGPRSRCDRRLKDGKVTSAISYAFAPVN